MLSVILPTCDEGATIEPLLQRLAAVRTTLGEPLEVLVVDKASADGTADIARTVLQQETLGRVVAGGETYDLAQAVHYGIHQAQGDLIGVMDADLSHPPELLPQLVRAVRAGCHVAIASRYVPGGGVNGWPWQRRLLSRLGNGLARPLVPVADAMSGYFVCQAQVAKSLPLQPRGFKILLELLVAGQLRHVREIPYVFHERQRGVSKLSQRVLWCYLMQLVRLYGRHVRRG